MDSKKAGWGAALSGLVVVGAAVGLIVAGNSDADTVKDSGPTPTPTVEVPMQAPQGPGDLDLDGDATMAPENKSGPGNNGPGSLPSIIPDSFQPDSQN